ncbi:MAG: ribosomal large subunit pseudouridine synthase F, partial [Cytophagales bacterium]|nr:ribosomal large subunit pseudouridine synthase F [Cytophagales bacterium]
IDEFFLEKMASGIQIMGRMTLPCAVDRLDERKFRITLIQGMNRQIRRMCYQMDYEVVELVRVRIGKVELGDLLPNEFRILEKESIL